MELGEFLKGATEIGKAMGVTLKHLRQKPVTVEFPYEEIPIYPPFSRPPRAAALRQRA